MKKPTVVAMALGLLLATPGASLAADLVIGVPNWSSGAVTAHVLKRLLEDEFDVTVELEKASNEEIFARMESGTMHIHPEVWLPNHEALSTEYVSERKTVEMSSKGVPARQGICATRHTREHFGIESVADLTDPKKAAILDTSGDGRGEMWIGASDWASTRIERVRAQGYGFAKTMQLLEAEEAMATAAIDAAVAVDKPLVFYCYEPHHVFALHDVVYLDETPHDPRDWKIVEHTDDADWLTESKADVAWPVSFFHIHYATKLADERPEIAAFLEAVRLDVDLVTDMTYSLIVERRDPGAFATEWVTENEERISSWRDAAK
ncbi:MAG: glycine betaine ABC transporter substrate-binding protein [Hyphomicrobiales bacterium]